MHEPFMFVLKTKILQDFDRRCLKDFYGGSREELKVGDLAVKEIWLDQES